MSFFKSAQLTALGCAASLLLAGSAAAQAHDGDWTGMLKIPSGQQLHLVLHVATAKGETTAILDSIDQNVSIPAAAYKGDGNKASILFFAIGAEMEGEFAPDNKTFTGVFRQGLAMPLTLTRTEAAAPAAKP
jgi:uncharacterized protein